MSHFLAMGGYARYLWPAYGITLLVVVLNVAWARRLLTQAKLDAQRRIQMQAVTK
ncbi:MAG TPA: heme exporter protein CcmD [Steroidobacteraceae bacterium]